MVEDFKEEKHNDKILVHENGRGAALCMRERRYLEDGINAEVSYEGSCSFLHIQS